MPSLFRQSLARTKNDSPRASGIEISVVVPILNEEPVIPELHSRLTASLSTITEFYQIVYVDDGSSDTSSGLLAQQADADARVTVVELSRNFGHQIAVSAGLEYATGDAVIVMDGDLQDPPEFLPELVAKFREGYEVVYAIRKERKEPYHKRLCYSFFYRLLRAVSGVHVPLDAGDFCIMDRRVVDLLCRMPERNRFIRGLRSWVGFRQTGIEYEREARTRGQSKYSLSRLMLLALDGFVSMSYLPLRLASLFGGLVSASAIAMAVFYVIKKLTVGLNPPGFATLITAIFFLAGIQLLTIGIMGEYVGRILDEVKARPLFVVKNVHGGKDSGPRDGK